MQDQSAALMAATVSTAGQESAEQTTTDSNRQRPGLAGREPRLLMGKKYITVIQYNTTNTHTQAHTLLATHKTK